MLAFAVVVVVVVLSECLPLLMAGRGDWLRVVGSKQQVREKERERERAKPLAEQVRRTNKRN